MSPLLEPPNRGYADWQRVLNWDSSVIWSFGETAGNQVLALPIADSSRDAYLGGTISLNAGVCVAVLNWFADAQRTTGTGFIQFALDSHITRDCQLHIPNLGSFIEIALWPIAGAMFTVGAAFILTNRVHPLEFIPVDQYLMHHQTAVLAAGGSEDIFPSNYYAGPVAIFASTDTQQFDLALSVLDPSGAYLPIDITRAPAASNFQYVRAAPSGAWKITATNRGGAADFVTVAVQHSTTGAI